MTSQEEVASGITCERARFTRRRAAMSGSRSFSQPHGGASPTKLTLVLPPLNKSSPSFKPGSSLSKSSKKAKGKGKERIRGPARPPKLKPLKEVLKRLITLAEKCVHVQYVEIRWR
jgi:hypothetical protein